MKSKQTQFLQQLVYTIEDITYTLLEEGGRFSEDYESKHQTTLAYKTETQEIKNFKGSKHVYYKADSLYGVEEYILEKVYKQELENTLYEMALERVKRKNITENF